MGDLVGRRRDRTERDIQRLRTAVIGWEARMLTSEIRTRHTGQLETLRGVFVAACDRLARDLKDPAKVSPDNLHAGCDAIDLQASYLQAAFDYYAERLEQHREPPDEDDAAEAAQRRHEARALRAADELLWSCYRRLFAGTARPPRPPPLTFFDPSTAPWALELDKSFHPADSLAARLPETENVPLRLLAVPRWMASEPWSLVLVIHELGHHVLREQKLQGAFGVLCAGAARQAGEPGRATLWQNWAEEVFADLFAAAAVGSEYVAALGEIVRGSPADMMRQPARYPATYVRLRVIQQFLELHGPPVELGDLRWGAGQAAGADPAARAMIDRDMAIAEQVARAAHGAGELAALWLARPDVVDVTRRLGAHDRPQRTSKGLDEPRIWASVLCRWWLDPARRFASDAERAERVAADLALVADSAEGGSRAGGDPPNLASMVDAILGLGPRGT
jgi:hypothetical protein